ncbi:MAG: hypothetical protein ACRDQU_07500 [Pseudonocardiaceae bacterium]
MGDISSIARHHGSGAGDCYGYGYDCPVDDVRGASLGEDPTDPVCGVLVQFSDVTPSEQATKLGLTGRPADLGDDGGRGDRDRNGPSARLPK